MNQMKRLKAKKKGLSITSDVHASHLVFNEKDVLDFDSNFKLMPPLRRDSDRIALWEGLKDGTIDTIVSDHRPFDKEEKDVEFDNASFGNISLQTAFSSLKNAKEFDLDTVLKALTINARNILGIENSPINENSVADLTVFDPNKKWVFKKSDVISSTTNSPFIDTELTGNVIAIINNGNLAIKD